MAKLLEQLGRSAPSLCLVPTYVKETLLQNTKTNTKRVIEFVS